jgi:enoyl-CoA hydratase
VDDTEARPLVRVERRDHVAVLTLDDPRRANAFTLAMCDQINVAVDALESDPDVSALVVTGAGPVFCAGADLSSLGDSREHGLRAIYDGFLRIARCSLPTVAAVNGAAVGAGMNLALAADVRIVSPSAPLRHPLPHTGHPPRRRPQLDAAEGGRPPERIGNDALRPGT